MDNSKTTQEALSKYIGTTRQMISQYMEGLAMPNIEKLRKVSDYFHISCDYLLGLSSSKNIDISSIQCKTGLSDEAIQCLAGFYHGFSNELFAIDYNTDIINYILSNKEFMRNFLNRLLSCWERKYEDEETSKRVTQLVISDESELAIYYLTKLTEHDLVERGYANFYKPTIKEVKQKPGPKG